jgi:hypothetical protein
VKCDGQERHGKVNWTCNRLLNEEQQQQNKNKNKKAKNVVGCNVLTAVTMKNTIFWNVENMHSDRNLLTFLQNISKLLPDYILPHPTRQHSSRSITANL